MRDHTKATSSTVRIAASSGGGSSGQWISPSVELKGFTTFKRRRTDGLKAPEQLAYYQLLMAVPEFEPYKHMLAPPRAMGLSSYKLVLPVQGGGRAEDLAGIINDILEQDHDTAKALYYKGQRIRANAEHRPEQKAQFRCVGTLADALQDRLVELGSTSTASICWDQYAVEVELASGEKRIVAYTEMGGKYEVCKEALAAIEPRISPTEFEGFLRRRRR